MKAGNHISVSEVCTNCAKFELKFRDRKLDLTLARNGSGDLLCCQATTILKM
jgi:hypothetical protein